jgi:predicted RND superfamily exporter protein
MVTIFFAYGITGIEFSTQVLDFYRPESKDLIRTIETDFDEGDYLTLIFESKDARTSLLEPEMLHQQFRVLKEIKKRFPVDTRSLADAIDEGLRRVKKSSLLDVSDYTTIAEGILGLSGGRTARDLEKVSRNLLSHPEAIGFYTRLRLALDVLPGAAPLQRSGGQHGAEETEFFPPTLQAMKAFVQFRGNPGSQEKRRMAVQIRDLARSFINEKLNVYLINRDLIGAEIDDRTAQDIIWMALTVMLAACFVFWIVFMRGQEVLISLVLMGTAVVWTFGLAGFLGFRLSFLHLLVLPILLGTGNDDAFVFGRQLQKERHDSPDLPAAIEKTFAKTGRAIFLTTLTTSIAFGVSAWVAGSEAVRSFDVLVAVSMVIIFFLTVLLQGPLRVWMGETEERSPRRGSSFTRTLHEKLLKFFLLVGTVSLRYSSRNPRRVLWVSLCVGLSGLCLTRPRKNILGVPIMVIFSSKGMWRTRC